MYPVASRETALPGGVKVRFSDLSWVWGTLLWGRGGRQMELYIARMGYGKRSVQWFVGYKTPQFVYEGLDGSIVRLNTCQELGEPERKDWRLFCLLLSSIKSWVHVSCTLTCLKEKRHRHS
jgi:hypothetical protein